VDLSDQKTQIILVIVLGVAGLIYVWYTYMFTPRKEEIDTLTEEIATLEQEIARFQLEADQAEEVEAQLAEARRQWAAILVQFPREPKEDELLANMSLAEEASLIYPIGLERGERRVQELYIEQDYVVRMIGEYRQVGRYISVLASQPRRVSVARMQLTHPSVATTTSGGSSPGPPPTDEEVVITLTITSYMVR
jgi:type IV pilus assembly protein PilO